MVAPLDKAYTQTYTRTFDQALDFSTAGNLSIEYRFDAVEAAPVTLSLLNANDDVLLSANLAEPVLSEFTNWLIPVYNQGVDLTAVKKVSIEVGTTTVPTNPEGVYFDNLVLRVPGCLEAILGDVNGDCQVNLDDFAEIASSWMTCNRFPAEACFSY